MIALIRIDDRLIHGQIVEGWVNYLKATSILVADDAVAGNTLQRTIMELSVPQGLKVFIGSVEEVCIRARTAGQDAGHAIVVFSNPEDVLRALNAGMECRSLNIGGMHYMPGKRKLMDVLAVNDADLDALRAISGKGIKIAIQTVPTQRPVPLEKVLDAASQKK
ncbi:MAG TPA: PTS sugar transporter subunit IIB [Nitrospirota bacterium]|nr:PTS sugar transporter subunit IIB [Nitrospirota bacterium]